MASEPSSDASLDVHRDDAHEPAERRARQPVPESRSFHLEEQSVRFRWGVSGDGHRTEAGQLELCVVVPTFKEAANVAELVRRLEQCLGDIVFEVVFVDDDSPDGTADVVRQLALHNPHVRCLQRIGRRGLSSACIEGMLATAAPYLAVMDADLQHDETQLPKMLKLVKQDGLDVVIGSRYVKDGSTGDWQRGRIAKSRLATGLSRMILRTDLADPMSGFFIVRREALAASVRNLSGLGFKILLDLLVSAPRPLNFAEIPYKFRNRHAGESKLDSTVMCEFIMMLLEKAVGHIVPVRFLLFSLVGGLGVLVHFAILAGFYQGLALSFITAHSLATFGAMSFNFFINNVLTYYDRRLKGWGLLSGWLSFCLACGIGALANVGVASYLVTNSTSWALSALAGIGIGAVWNYAVTATYIWQPKKKARQGTELGLAR